MGGDCKGVSLQLKRETKTVSVAFAQTAGTSPHLYRNDRAVGTVERNVRAISRPALSKDYIKKPMVVTRRLKLK